MTATTNAQRGASNRRKGQTAERDVAKFLRSVGFPDAERAVVTGGTITGPGGEIVRLRADPGDIAGVPFIVSVKDCGTEQIDKWLDELDAMQHLTGLPGPLRMLVHKRRGKASPGRWWCWMRLSQFARLTGGDCALGLPVRMEFEHALHLVPYVAEEVES